MSNESFVIVISLFSNASLELYVAFHCLALNVVVDLSNEIFLHSNVILYHPSVGITMTISFGSYIYDFVFELTVTLLLFFESSIPYNSILSKLYSTAVSPWNCDKSVILPSTL